MAEEPGIQQVRRSYLERSGDSQRYDGLKPVVLAQAAERRAVVAGVIAKILQTPLSEAKILDIGCGDGRELNEFLWLGALPEHLAGNDLQETRVAVARRRLPEAVRLVAGDVRTSGFDVGSFDMVTLFVVLMTIKDEELRTAVLRHAYDLVKPGGLLIVSEPIIPNPRNKNVTRIRQSELILTLGAKPIISRRMHLVPPLSNAARFPTLYSLMSALVPFLKFHKLWVFQKA